MEDPNRHWSLMRPMTDQEEKRRKMKLARGQETETENRINDESKRTTVKEAFESKKTNDMQYKSFEPK